LGRGRRRAGRGGRPGRGSALAAAGFGGTQHPQEVAAPDRGDLLARVAAAQQLGGDVGRVGLAVEAGDAGAVVEVAADPDVLHADAPGDVVQVVDQVGEGGRLLVLLERVVEALAGRRILRVAALVGHRELLRQAELRAQAGDLRAPGVV